MDLLFTTNVEVKKMRCVINELNYKKSSKISFQTCRLFWYKDQPHFVVMQNKFGDVAGNINNIQKN